MITIGDQFCSCQFHSPNSFTDRSQPLPWKSIIFQSQRQPVCIARLHYFVTVAIWAIPVFEKYSKSYKCSLWLDVYYSNIDKIVLTWPEIGDRKRVVVVMHYGYDKVVAILLTIFKMHFCQWKWIYLDSKLIEVCSWESHITTTAPTKFWSNWISVMANDTLAHDIPRPIDAMILFMPQYARPPLVQIMARICHLPSIN